MRQRSEWACGIRVDMIIMTRSREKGGRGGLGMTLPNCVRNGVGVGWG